MKIGDQNIDIRLYLWLYLSDEFGFERVTFGRCQVLMFVESFAVVVKLHLFDVTQSYSNHLNGWSRKQITVDPY